VVQCLNFNCVHNDKSICIQNTITINKNGECAVIENRSDSEWETSIIPKIPSDPQLPNITASLNDVIQKTLKTVDATCLIQIYSFPTFKQPYLLLLVQLANDTKKVVTVQYQPKGEK